MKKGQVTIFIIIAVLIVAFAILIYIIYPDITTDTGFDSKNPSAFIQSCLEEEIENNVERLSLQGGSLAPEHYIMYNDERLEY